MFVFCLQGGDRAAEPGRGCRQDVRGLHGRLPALLRLDADAASLGYAPGTFELCIDICVCIFIHLCIYIFMYIHIFIHIFLPYFDSMLMPLLSAMLQVRSSYASIYVYVYLSIYVFIYSCIFIYLYISSCPTSTRSWCCSCSRYVIAMH